MASLDGFLGQPEEYFLNIHTVTDRTNVCFRVETIYIRKNKKHVKRLTTLLWNQPLRRNICDKHFGKR
jgi:hypothetical protein